MEILKSQKINEIQKVQNSSTNHLLTLSERRHQHHSPSINQLDNPDKSREYHTNGHHQQDGKQQQHHKYHNAVKKSKNQKNPNKSVDLKGNLKRYILETSMKMLLKRT